MRQSNLLTTCAIERFGGLYGISLYLLACESLLDVDAHEVPDEVFGVLADVVPVRGVKLKLTFIKNSFSYLFTVFIMIKYVYFSTMGSPL